MTNTPNASGSCLGAFDLAEDLASLFRAYRGEERLDVLVRHELDEEVDVVRDRRA